MDITSCDLNGFKLYKIFADYRPKDSIKKHWYYVIAKNKTEAKRRFSNRISWLKVYEVIECTDKAFISEVLNNQHKYIVF